MQSCEMKHQSPSGSVIAGRNYGSNALRSTRARRAVDHKVTSDKRRDIQPLRIRHQRQGLHGGNMMLEKAKNLLQPSGRSNVPRSWSWTSWRRRRLEAQGAVSPYGSRPAGGRRAGDRARRGAGGACKRSPGYTEALGIPSLRRRIAATYRERHGLTSAPNVSSSLPARRRASSWRSLQLSRPGDRVAVALPGYPPYRHILTALGCEPVRIETSAATRLVDYRRGTSRRASRGARSRG